MVRCDVCNSWHQHQLMSSSAHLLICSSGHLLSISINISISISISPSAELLICLSVHLLICSETEKRKKIAQTQILVWALKIRAQALGGTKPYKGSVGTLT